MPKINYQKGLIAVVLIDLVLLGLVVVGGYRVVSQYFPGWISLDAGPDEIAVEQPANITLRTPDQIKASQDFFLVVQIQNQNLMPIHIREIILPRMVMDNMTVLETDPIVDKKNSYDVGEGFPFDLSIAAGEEKNITFRIIPSKMQSINTEVLTYTDNFIIPTGLQFVVAP